MWIRLNRLCILGEAVRGWSPNNDSTVGQSMYTKQGARYLSLSQSSDISGIFIWEHKPSLLPKKITGLYYDTSKIVSKYLEKSMITLCLQKCIFKK
jgi:hypothetical protein